MNFNKKVEDFLSLVLKQHSNIFLVDLKISNDKSIKIILDGDKEVNVKDCWQRTPLRLSYHFGIYECLFIEHAAKMDLYSLSLYRTFKGSKLACCFRYFKSKTDDELFDILTQKDATIRPFIYGLIQNNIYPFDHSIGVYACDLIVLYRRYQMIRSYLEHGFGFKKNWWSTNKANKAYLKRYRIWVACWRLKHRSDQMETHLMIPTFNLRFTQNTV